MLMFGMTDYDWNSHPYCATKGTHCPLRHDARRQSARINRIRPLRTPAQSLLVVQTIHDILPRTHGHESMRAHNLPFTTMDIESR